MNFYDIKNKMKNFFNNLNWNDIKSNKNVSIYLGITVLVIVIIISCFCIFGKKSNSKVTILNSSDNKFSISIPSNIKYKVNSKENNEFVIDLYSEQDDMYMYASTISKARELDLYEVASDDKKNYLKDKENIRDDSGILETTVDNNKAYEYNLVYSDTKFNKDFYCHVVWIETEDNIYVLNFEVSEKNMDKYKEIFNNIKNSFISKINI